MLHPGGKYISWDPASAENIFGALNGFRE